MRVAYENDGDPDGRGSCRTSFTTHTHTHTHTHMFMLRRENEAIDESVPKGTPSFAGTWSKIGAGIGAFAPSYGPLRF
jgi:hypothetical protein